MRVVSIGDNCLDAYVAQGLLVVGGNAANVAAAFSRLGQESTYIGAIGDDAAASVVREVLAQAVDHLDLHALEGRTGVTLIQLEGNDREFLHEDFGVGQAWSPDDTALNRLGGADWVHVAGSGTAASTRRRLVESGHRVSVDLSTEPVPEDLENLHVAFASWAPGVRETRHERAHQILSSGARMAVVTGGSYGSLAVTARETEEFAALPIVPVDTCGAGDSFIAGFLCSHLKGDGLRASLAAGTAVASETCLHLGGFPQEPRPIPSWVLDSYGEHLPALATGARECR